MGCVINPMPQPLYPQEIPGTHYIGGWVRPRAGAGAENLAPLGFDPLTAQPVARRYTNYVIPAHNNNNNNKEN
jgi:hypothetical protein